MHDEEVKLFICHFFAFSNYETIICYSEVKVKNYFSEGWTWQGTTDSNRDRMALETSILPLEQCPAKSTLSDFENIFSQNLGSLSRTIFSRVGNANELSRGGRGLESQELFSKLLKIVPKSQKDSAKPLKSVKLKKVLDILPKMW